MSEETLTENFKRSYEVSIWTLQDSFITVLKPFNLEPKGQIQEAKMTLKDDGTQELSFSIPMYIRDEDGTKHENPIWYNTRNGTIIADLRKIKVIFDKGGRDEAVFEFMIIKVTESHENDELRCEVECEGLAFHELGKIGYKISLNEEDYTEDWMEWSKDTSADRGDEPAATIDYWMYKVLNKNRINWTYSVQMDWGAYDGTIIVGVADDSARVGYAYIEDLYTGKLAYTTPKQYSDLTDEEKEYLNNLRIAKGMRRYDKIYEENYVTSWSVDDNKNMITPVSVEKRREKQRLINIEESNIYNITQTIAETFGVFCKYVYHYDDTYHIIGREIVFYNNFIQESSGHIDFTYPYHTNSISREMDATDTISKMFVKPLANDSASTGYANIMDTAANKSGEDYLLNFSYLHNIGTISEEQFNEIEPYEVKMRKFNDLMIPIEKRIVQLNASLPEKEAALEIAKNSQSLAKDQISAADDQLQDILKRTNPNNNNPQSIVVDGSHPTRVTPTKEKNGTYSIPIRQQGVIPGTVEIYSGISSNTGELIGKCSGVEDFDEFGNLTKLKSVTNIEFDENNIIKIKYLTYEYVPQLWFENMKKTYTSRLAQDEQKEAALTQEIDSIKQELAQLQAQYDEYKDEKEKVIIDFQNMMGPALREGYWQPEDEYAGYGDKYSENYALAADSAFDNTKLSSLGWDNEPFEGEQLNYYLEGVNKEQVYYPFIWIDQAGLDVLTAEEYDKISFCYLDCATKNSSNNPLKYTRYWTVGSQMMPVYLRQKNTNTVAPAFLLIGAASLSDDSWADLMTIKGEAPDAQPHEASIAIVTTNTTDPENPELVITKRWHNIGARFMTNTEAENYEVVYPRFQVTSLEMQDTDDQLSLLQNNDVLENFKDYKVLIRDENYYVTLDSYTLIKSGSLFGGALRFNYTIANTALLIYLDAIQVLKENCMPKVSYQITPSLVSREFMRIAYKGLDKISHINDYELKFENVLGYISEMELDLDRPQEDTYEIKNYKTKFEDLFSTIVAQTEEMKKNSIEIGLAAGAFTATGDLKGSQVQSVMDRVDLNYAFNQGALTIDEANGIWATSDSGVVAMRGGGIFTATDKDQDGNWIWNTGILPSGINASLITTGQLDTNLIRIYAGDTIAFQMNADGLYAYKWDLGSDSYQNQYVVHNKDGLFLHDDTIQTSSGGVDRVAITWDGLTLRNKAGNKVFEADNTYGNLTITGTINATGLSIEGQTSEQYIKEHNGENLIKNSETIYLEASASHFAHTNLYSPLINGETYTITFGSVVQTDSGSAPAFLTLNGYCSNPSADFRAANVEISATKKSYTFEVPDDGNTYALILYHGVGGSDVAGHSFTLSNVKLEVGNVATDWSSAAGELYGASLIVDANQGLIDMRSTSSSSTSAFTMTPNKISVVTSDFRLGTDSEDEAILSFIGSTNNNFSLRIGPWGVNNTAFYRNNTTFGTQNGLYFGVEGLSLSNIFNAHLNASTNAFDYFMIKSGNKNTDGSDEILLSVEPTDSGSYQLNINIANFNNNFISNLKDALRLDDTGSAKVYAVPITSNLPTENIAKGSIGVRYTDVIQSQSVTLSSVNANSPTSLKEWNQMTTTDWANCNTAYPYYSVCTWQYNKNRTFYAISATYWNVSSLHSDDNTGNYQWRVPPCLGRVGVGTSTDNNCALFALVKANNTVSAGNNITLNFYYIINPNTQNYNSKIGSSNWHRRPISIQITANDPAAISPTIIATGSFTVGDFGKTNDADIYASTDGRSFHLVSLSLTTVNTIQANTTYAVTFYASNPSSQLGGAIYILQRDFRIADGKIANYSGNLTVTDVGAAVGVSLSGQGQTTTTPTAEIYVMAQTTASTKNWIKVATGTATS